MSAPRTGITASPPKISAIMTSMSSAHAPVSPLPDEAMARKNDHADHDHDEQVYAQRDDGVAHAAVDALELGGAGAVQSLPSSGSRTFLRILRS